MLEGLTNSETNHHSRLLAYCVAHTKPKDAVNNNNRRQEQSTKSQKEKERREIKFLRFASHQRTYFATAVTKPFSHGNIRTTPQRPMDRPLAVKKPRPKQIKCKNKWLRKLTISWALRPDHSSSRERAQHPTLSTRGRRRAALLRVTTVRLEQPPERLHRACCASVIFQFGVENKTRHGWGQGRG